MATSNFAWASAADVGTGLIQGFFSAQTSRAVARAENRVRGAQNVARAGRNSLMATIKGINDQRTMEAAGKNYNAAVTNASRMADAFTRGDWESVIRGMETAGSVAARGAASGVTGASNRAAEYSAQLSVSRAAEQRRSTQGKALYDAQLSASGLVSNAFGSLDRSRNYAQMDTATAVGGGYIESILGGLAGKTSSLHTMLGSLAGVSSVGTGVTTSPVSQGSAIGTDLGTLAADAGDTGAVAYPVQSRWVTGQPLDSLPVIQFKSQVKGI